MKNIPMFTTEYGVANLFLKNVPYSGAAFVQIISTSNCFEFLKECRDFCRAVGAERIYASGHDALGQLTMYTKILTMSRKAAIKHMSDCKLVRVTSETSESWRDVYNRCMAGVPAADYMSKTDMRSHIERGDAYYIYRNDDLLGIGVASGENIDAVAGLRPHVGESLMYALLPVLTGETIHLQVAAENKKAYNLYSKMGFTVDAVVEVWYDTNNLEMVSRKNT